jgi:TRAP-type uncharacterized transport system substrate-binding protein
MNRLSPIIVIASLLTACDSVSRDLVLARPDSPIDQQIVASMVELFDEQSAVRIRLSDQPMTGGDALLAVAEGRADLALISNDQPFRDDIATVMPLYSTVLHIVQLADHEASTINDLLRDKLVYAGPAGSASRRVFERLTAGIEFGDEGFRFATEQSTSVDLAVVFAPISPERLREYPDVRLWSVGTPDEIGRGGIIDSVVLLNPHFRPFIIPAGTYGAATTSPVVTIAVDKLIVAREDIDRSLVYDLVNELLRRRPALATIHPGLFQGVSDSFDASRSRYVLHAGTQDFLQRAEPTFIERYSGVAEVLVTLMIAAFSATVAAIRIFNRRRKNRIDRFYKAALDIRDAAITSTDIGKRRDAVQKVRQLQDDAFAKLVDEKLAADESFRIFITLTNDIAQQLDAH